MRYNQAMQIEGANFNNYDARHLQIVRRESPQSIKPNLFREVDESVAQALLYTDVVNLSPEAKELLKKLKRQMAGRTPETQRDESNVGELIYTLQQFRELVRKEQQDEDTQGEPDVSHEKPRGTSRFQPPVLQLGVPLRGGSGTRPGGALRDLVNRMIAHTPDEESRQLLIDELIPLGEKMLDTVLHFGVRVIVLERSQSLTDLRLKGLSVVSPGEKTFDGRPWAVVRGLYDQSRRLMVVGRENLGQRGHSTARHEFAHAFDHTFMVRHSRRQPLSVQLWNLFAEQRKEFVTPYAATNPAEYWAESVENYHRDGGRARLAQCDPQMCLYLEALFAS